MSKNAPKQPFTPHVQAVEPPEPVDPPKPPELQYLPAIKSVNFYFGIGDKGRLYAFSAEDPNWRVGSAQEVERIMLAVGIPANLINALKNLRL